MNITQEKTIDLRKMIPGERHKLVFQTFDALQVDMSFVIMTDHDPKPLKHQFETLRPELSQWEYISKGDPWTIKITKVREYGDSANEGPEEGPEEGCCGICGD